MYMINFNDLDNEILEPGENGSPEDVPYEGSYDTILYKNSKTLDWRTSMSQDERKNALLTRMANMPEDDYNMMLKVVRADAINEMLDAISNLKGTTEDSWKKIINKLQFLTNFNDTETSKFDFNKALRTLLPLLAALAGLLIALRKSEAAESEASCLPDEIQNDPVFKAIKENRNKVKDINDDDLQIDEITGKIKSVVLQNCQYSKKGFSLT